jgi:hypothetical protein
MLRALMLVISAVAMVTYNPAEQATRGRNAYREAVTALRGGDSTTALAQLQVAHSAWPAQTAYSEALVRVAARLNDTTTVLRTLATLTAQQLGGSLERDAVLTALAARAASVQAARERLLAANRGPEISTARTLSEDTTFFPEGLARDANDGTLFVTSLARRNVLVVPLTGASRWLLPEDPRGRGAVYGVVISRDRRTLWLSTGATPHMGLVEGDSAVVAEILEVDRASGAIRRRVTLGDGKGSPGEITALHDGTVLVSDGTQGRLYRLRPRATSTETVTSPLLRSPQGIAALENNRVAIVADWSHGLLRWDLATDSIVAIEPPSAIALLGVDGLVWTDDGLIAVQNGASPMRVLQVRLSADQLRVESAVVLDRPREMRGEMTIAAVAARRVSYIASSAWPFWNDEGERVANSGPLPPVVIREFTLPERLRE